MPRGEAVKGSECWRVVEHFSCEAHIVRYLVGGQFSISVIVPLQRSVTPSLLLNIEQMDVAQRHATLKSLLRKRSSSDAGAHFYEADGPLPALVVNAAFDEDRVFHASAASVREFGGTKWRWCQVNQNLL